MIAFIQQKLRATALADSTLYDMIGTRFFPENVDLETDTNTFPMITFSLMGGFPDADNYASNVILLDMSFISDNSVDEAAKIYKQLKSLINTELFSDTDNQDYFIIREDTLPIDASGLYGDKLLYVYSNTWQVKTIETP